MDISIWLSFGVAVMSLVLSMLVLTTSKILRRQEIPKTFAGVTIAADYRTDQFDDHLPDSPQCEQSLLNDNESRSASEDGVDLEHSDLPTSSAVAYAERRTSRYSHYLALTRAYFADCAPSINLPVQNVAPLLLAFFVCPARLVLVFEILVPFASRHFAMTIAQVSCYQEDRMGSLSKIPWHMKLLTQYLHTHRPITSCR